MPARAIAAGFFMHSQLLLAIGEAMPFQPGQSGNPKGRAVETDGIKTLARQHTAAAIEALVAALTDPKQRVAAAVALLDRAYGKPKQEVTGEDGAPLFGDLTIRLVRPGELPKIEDAR